MLGQVCRKAGIQRLALVVIDGRVVESEGAGWVSLDAAGKAANDIAALLGNLIGVCEMELAQMRQLWRPQSHLPGADQSTIDGDGEVHVGFAEVGVVEEVVHAVFDSIHVEKPAPERNLNAELVLFVAFGGEGREGVLASGLLTGVIQDGFGYRFKRRGLKEVSVEAAQNPMQFWNLKSRADAGISRRLVQSGVVAGEAHAAEQGEVLAQAQVVRQVTLDERGAGGAGVGTVDGARGCCIVDDAEQIALGLVERVHATGKIVGAGIDVHVSLATHII